MEDQSNISNAPNNGSTNGASHNQEPEPSVPNGSDQPAALPIEWYDGLLWRLEREAEQAKQTQELRGWVKGLAVVSGVSLIGLVALAGLAWYLGGFAQAPSVTPTPVFNAIAELRAAATTMSSRVTALETSAVKPTVAPTPTNTIAPTVVATPTPVPAPTLIPTLPATPSVITSTYLITNPQAFAPKLPEIGIAVWVIDDNAATFNPPLSSKGWITPSSGVSNSMHSVNLTDTLAFVTVTLQMDKLLPIGEYTIYTYIDTGTAAAENVTYIADLDGSILLNSEVNQDTIKGPVWHLLGSYQQNQIGLMKITLLANKAKTTGKGGVGIDAIAIVRRK